MDSIQAALSQKGNRAKQFPKAIKQAQKDIDELRRTTDVSNSYKQEIDDLANSILVQTIRECINDDGTVDWKALNARTSNKIKWVLHRDLFSSSDPEFLYAFTYKRIMFYNTPIEENGLSIFWQLFAKKIDLSSEIIKGSFSIRTNAKKDTQAITECQGLEGIKAHVKGKGRESAQPNASSEKLTKDDLNNNVDLCFNEKAGDFGTDQKLTDCSKEKDQNACLAKLLSSAIRTGEDPLKFGDGTTIKLPGNIFNALLDAYNQYWDKTAPYKPCLPSLGDLVVATGIYPWELGKLVPAIKDFEAGKEYLSQFTQHILHLSSVWPPQSCTQDPFPYVCYDELGICEPQPIIETLA